jgi:hypothetical protein
VVTVAIKGSDRSPPPKKRQRLTLLQAVASALVAREGWPEVHAIVLPGGFFRLKRPIGLTTLSRRLARFARTGLASDMLAIVQALQERWPGVALIIGIDSAPLSKTLGGDQLIAVWQNGALAALTAKAFPVDGDTNGEVPPYIVSPDDADDPARIVTLSNGARALILSCYDAFAVRGLYGRRHVDLGAIRFLISSDDKVIRATPGQRHAHLRRWLAFLDAHPPDLALIAIHRFRQPGQDGYWQRHGVAGASAALGGAPVIGAAHFRRALPSSIAASPLAAIGVPLAHLDAGARRTAHRATPQDGFTLRDELGEPVALIRLFTLHHRSTTP